MKYIYIILGLMLTLSGYAQNKHTKKADKLFESHQYVAAIEAYEKLITNKKADGFVYKQLADSYYHLSNMKKAAQYYAKAIKSKQNAEAYYNYAQTLKTQGNYQEANKQMDAFSNLSPNDQRAKAYKANPNYISEIQAKNKAFEVTKTSLNAAKSSDFAAILGNDNRVYFVSNRNNNTKTDTWSDTPYLDIYQSEYGDGTLTEPIPVDELNTKYHDGPVTLSADGNIMFFSRDGLAEGDFERNKKANTKIGKLGIYRAEKKEGKWTNIKPLPFNSTKYSVGSPSLSKDGKTLYFASDMPGGLGDTDIWKVAINTNGSYGKPVNMGDKINTEGKENFPFISDDNILYFASNGKQGLGGLDVFKADLTTNTEAENLGQPVNSNKDDFAFTFNKDQGIGFLSTNREGSDNIYYAMPICGGELIAVIKDAKTGQVLPGASVALMDGGTIIDTETSAINGSANFHTECNKAYSLKASLKNYETNSTALERVKGGTTQIEVMLQPIEVVITDKEVLLDPIYFDFDKSDVTKQAAKELDKLVKVMNSYPEMVILVRSHTDTKGSSTYNLNLSEKRAQATVQYIISKGITEHRISGEGMGENEPKVDCGDTCTKEQDAQNRRSEFRIVKKEGE